MTIRFPQKRPDGTFDVVVRLTGVQEEDSRVREWISVWVQQNACWERVWEGADRTVEVLHLLDDFFSPPECESHRGTEVAVRFRARSEAKMWKDWVAKFVEEFGAAYPDATLLSVESG